MEFSSVGFRITDYLDACVQIYFQKLTSKRKIFNRNFKFRTQKNERGERTALLTP